jgi:hypothetical protein
MIRISNILPYQWLKQSAKKTQSIV